MSSPSIIRTVPSLYGSAAFPKVFKFPVTLSLLLLLLLAAAAAAAAAATAAASALCSTAVRVLYV